MNRKLLDINTKKHIIKLATTGLSHQQIAMQYGIGRSTVTKILLNKQKIHQYDYGIFSNNKLRIRCTDNYELEKIMLEWCRPHIIYNHQGGWKLSEAIDNTMILEKATQVVTELNIQCEINNAWLAKFRRKFKIEFKIIKSSKNHAKLTSSANNIIVKSNVPLQFEFNPLNDHFINSYNLSPISSEFILSEQQYVPAYYSHDILFHEYI